MNNELLRALSFHSYRNPTPMKGSRCGFCSAMKPKELRRHDSCPECGRSLFAKKQKKWSKR